MGGFVQREGLGKWGGFVQRGGLGKCVWGGGGGICVERRPRKVVGGLVQRGEWGEGLCRVGAGKVEGEEICPERRTGKEGALYRGKSCRGQKAGCAK